MLGKEIMFMFNSCLKVYLSEVYAVIFRGNWASQIIHVVVSDAKWVITIEFLQQYRL